MSNFTPGPWSLLLPHELWVGRPIDDWAITVDDHDTWICTGPTWDADHSEESAANGRLISAAPELLSVAYTVDYVADMIDHDPDSAFGELVAKARAAIAKATGSQP